MSHSGPRRVLWRMARRALSFPTFLNLDWVCRNRLFVVRAAGSSGISHPCVPDQSMGTRKNEPNREMPRLLRRREWPKRGERSRRRRSGSERFHPRRGNDRRHYACSRNENYRTSCPRFRAESSWVRGHRRSAWDQSPRLRHPERQVACHHVHCRPIRILHTTTHTKDRHSAAVRPPSVYCSTRR